MITCVNNQAEQQLIEKITFILSSRNSQKSERSTEELRSRVERARLLHCPAERGC